MPVRYSGPSGPEELIPAPLVAMSMVPVRDEGGRLLRHEYDIQLTGTIVNVGTTLDSPGAQNEVVGDSPTMEDVLSEQKRIRKLFSGDGGRLEIETPDGGGPNTLDFYCTVDSISFTPSTWVNRSDYTISLKSSKLTNENTTDSELRSSNETWTIVENEDGTFGISHQLSAVGTLIYSASGVNNPQGVAKSWCRDHSFKITNGTITPYTGSSSIDFSNILSKPTVKPML